MPCTSFVSTDQRPKIMWSLVGIERPLKTTNVWRYWPWTNKLVPQSRYPCYKYKIPVWLMIKNKLVWSSSRVLFHNNRIHKEKIFSPSFILTNGIFKLDKFSIDCVRKTSDHHKKINLFNQSVSIVRLIWPTLKVLGGFYTREDL